MVVWVSHFIDIYGENTTLLLTVKGNIANVYINVTSDGLGFINVQIYDVLSDSLQFV